MSHPLFSELQKVHSGMFVSENQSLSAHNTLRLGGNAELFAIATKQSELFDLLKFLYRHPDLPYTILGSGSNVVISDAGLPGLTIVNKANKIDIHPRIHEPDSHFKVTYTQRNENEPEKYLDFTKLDYDESGLPYQEVTIQAGTPLPFAISQLISSGLTGLQWFGYIPGTIGGAVYQNIHGGRYHFADYIDTIKAFDLKTGKTVLFRKENLNWKYETSFFQNNPHLAILSVTLKLFRGDTTTATEVYKAWIAQKSKVQPLASPGSAFANPSLEICQKIWGEQKSTGWIIDHELNLKGYSIGGAKISLEHSNFFINTGDATAADFYNLVKHVQNIVYEKFGLKLIPEIKFLGKFT